MTVRTNALVRVLCSNCAALAQKMLAQHRLLALVVGANVGSIEHIGLLGHSFEGELADWLSVLDHKRHIARTDLECRPASARLATAREAEPRIEEPGVMRAQLASRRIVREHLSGV